MTPPKGYRPCTADDLREGVEVLISATVDDDGYAALRPPNGSRSFILPEFFAGLALIRDDAAPDTDKATALRERDEARADVAMLRTTVTGLTERADRANAEADRWASGFRVALGIGVVPFGEISDLAEAHAAKVRRMADLLAMRRPEPADSAAVADLRAQLRSATGATMQAAGRSGRLDEMIKAAAILCEIDADGPEERLSALIDRARGGGR